MSDNLTAALAAVQAELPEIRKGETAVVPTKTGGSYKYSYADLADVSQVILPLLGKNGLAWMTKPTFNSDGKFVLAYKLKHISGEEEAGEYPLTSDRGTPQEIGSAITYARRYALCAVTGVAPAADDDDGAAASHRSPRQDEWEQAEKPATPEQVAEYESLLTDLAAVTTRDGFTDLGRRVTSAQAQSRITPAQYRALDVTAGAKLVELQQSEAS